MEKKVLVFRLCCRTATTFSAYCLGLIKFFGFSVFFASRTWFAEGNEVAALCQIYPSKPEPEFTKRMFPQKPTQWTLRHGEIQSFIKVGLGRDGPGMGFSPAADIARRGCRKQKRYSKNLIMVNWSKRAII